MTQIDIMKTGKQTNGLLSFYKEKLMLCKQAIVIHKDKLFKDIKNFEKHKGLIDWHEGREYEIKQIIEKLE